MTIPASDPSPWQALLSHLQSPQAKDLFQRVEQLRKVLTRLAIILFAVMGLSFYFSSDIFYFLKIPLIEALPGQKNVLHFTGPLEVMMAYMKVSFLAAAMVVAPLACFWIWRFIMPSLPDAQHAYVIPFFLASLTLFIIGVLFAYFAMLPMGLKWLIGFAGSQAIPIITVTEYIDMLTFMLLGFGTVFQFPLVIVLIERLGIVSGATLKKKRPLFVIGILILAALVAPSPDPLSQLSLAVPMYLLFEGALLVITLMNRNQDKNLTLST